MNPSSAATTKKKKRISISNIAFLLMSTALLGQLLGFLRTKLVNANFPTTGPHSTDAYFAAFTIPDFFFFTLAAGALGVAFMPVLSDRLHKNGRRSAWELADWLLNLLAVVMAVVAVIIIIFAEPLIKYIVAPGLSPEQLDTAATIMRFLAFNPLLFTISGILTSVQQTLGRFFFFAIAPLFYNLSIIISIFVFKDNVGLVGLGLGALIGAVLQLLVVACGLWKTSFHWRPGIVWKSQDFRVVLRNLPPRSLDQGMDQVENIVETNIASTIGSGSITYWSNAYILSTAPILLIGTAISTAAFPRLNARLSQHRPDLFRKDFLMVLRAMIWIIATIFGFLTVAIFFRIMYSIISRWFYAQKDTITPLLVSLAVIALNVFLAYTLSRPDAYGVSGLALAQSIVAAVEVFILSIIMLIRDPKLFDAKFWGGVWRIISVTGFSVVAGFIMISLYPLGINDKGILALGSKLVVIAAVVFGVHIIVSAIFGLEEVRPLLNKARKIMLKPIKIGL
jgi:putative peptidoglycan lipid II flippase